MSFEKVFVYGTLKQGFGNHHVMERAGGRLRGFHTTEPSYTMHSLGGFPAVMRLGSTPIHGEVYEVEDMQPLDRLEGYPSMYTREQIITPWGMAWMYLWTSKYRELAPESVIESGTWEKLEKYF